MFRDRIFRGERFFRHHWSESPFQKGDLKYVILDLIKDKPRYGYEIIRALEERSHGFYTPSPGVVYPTLQMLEEMDYARSTEMDGKKVYSITESGLQFLAERKEQAEEVKSQMKHHWNPENIGILAPLMGEFGELVKLVGRRGRHTEPDKMKRIREIVSRAIQDVKTILEEE
ncbi:MAG: PadR family transcriptional regulator [Promethearchaeota archaeon]